MVNRVFTVYVYDECNVQMKQCSARGIYGVCGHLNGTEYFHDIIPNMCDTHK